MRLTTPPEFQSEVLLRDVDFARLDGMLREEALEHGLDLHNGHGRSTWCETEMGEFGVKKRGDDVLVFARAHRPEWLAAIQEAISEHLLEAAPDLGHRLAWPTGEDVGRWPANFSLARVESVVRIAPDFLRLRLSAPDLARLATGDSIHFRLVLPPAGVATPEWPRIGANGQAIWPKGAMALHRPVYTVRAADAAAGWIETDVFLHPGGRVTDWAKAEPLGQVIGLSGPSGGGIPEQKELFLAGDETAYPAIARILAARPDALARVYLFGATAGYPMPPHLGSQPVHLPGGTRDLVQILQCNPVPHDAHLWIAGEKSEIAALRELVIDQLGHDRGRVHLGSYWARAGTQKSPAQ